MNELVSVVIPTYKNRGALQKSIESALAQNNANVEIIVVDDNAPDTDERRNTEEVMVAYQGNNRVNYIRHEKNKNGAAARNTGIKASKGCYIAFLDDDDFFFPDKICKQVDYLKANPNVDAVYCFAGRNGKRYGTTSYEGNATKQMLMLETCMYTPTLMFRRDSLISINGFDEAFRRNQDYDLLLRFFHAGYKIGCLPVVLSEIGTNEGENALSGDKLEETKAYFFEKFQTYIKEIEAKEPGFEGDVYAKHYAGVFLTHVKTRNFKKAFRVFRKYYFMSPCVFNGVVLSSLIQHLKGVNR